MGSMYISSMPKISSVSLGNMLMLIGVVWVDWRVDSTWIWTWAKQMCVRLSIRSLTSIRSVGGSSRRAMIWGLSLGHGLGLRWVRGCRVDSLGDMGGMGDLGGKN